MLKPVGCLVLCALAGVSLSGCGGGSSPSTGGGGGGGGGTTPTSVEYFYGLGGSNIYVYKADTATGVLSATQTVTPNTSDELGATAILKQGSNQFLYAVSGLGNAVFAFSIASSGTVTPVGNSSYTVPQSLIYQPYLETLMPSSDGTHLYMLDQSGSIVVADIDSTGAITYDSVVQRSSLEIGFGAGAALDPSGEYIYYTTGAINEYDQQGDSYAGVLGYSIAASTGIPSVMSGSPATLPPNGDPSFIVNTPSGQFYYVGLNGTGSIAAFSRNSSTGTLATVTGSPFTAGGIGAELTGLAMHPSGKYLYTVDLRDHSILGYSIDSSTGALTALAGSPFAAQTTSNGNVVTQGPLTVDPSGNLLFVLTNGNYVAVYTINQSTGALTVAGSMQSTPLDFYGLSTTTVN